MTLKEKFAYMATSKPYNDLDPLLIEARNKATEDTNKLNAENDPAKKEQLIRKLFGSAGKTPFVNPNFRCEFGQNIHVGDNFYANYDCVILDGAPVTIGDNTIIGTGSVMTHDIPANVIAAGVPAKVIRPITEKDKTGFDPNDPRFL